MAKALHDHIITVDHTTCDAGDEDSFFVADLGEVVRSFKTWKQLLPNVQPFYAVKCNPDIHVIKLLASMGCNFDCASKFEIDLVLSLGIAADRIVYANPCKTNSFIRNARECNVSLTTVDNAQELHKLHKFHPHCGILIRIATDDELAQCRLSTKFGCTVKTACDELLPLAKALGLPVRGVAYHVGSGATDFSSIYKATRDARVIFDRASELALPAMTILDIGGGFERLSFADSAAVVQSSLQEFFPPQFTEEHGVKFIAEPGRFMVSHAFTLATHVIARRDYPADVAADAPSSMLYVNDGVYGNLNCILFDHQHPTAHVLTQNGEFLYNVELPSLHKFSIWGPTCDGLDCISSCATLSRDVQVGDWLYFPQLGAYTSAASTSFNGFKGLALVIYVRSQD